MSEQKNEDLTDLNEVVWKDPRRMSGTPCFRGTRVPVKNLTDYLKGGYSLDRFLEGFPGVEREQAERYLDLAAQMADDVPAETDSEPRDESSRHQPA